MTETAIEEIKPRMIVLHHDDLDGFMSAAVIKFYMRQLMNLNTIFIPVQYNQPCPLFEMELTNSDTVYIVDFSYDKETILKLRESSRIVRVIDHHASALEELVGLEDCYLDDSVAGCVGTWRYFFRKKKVPFAVQVADDYDRFIHETGYSEALNAWFKASDRSTVIDQLAEFIRARHLLIEATSDAKIIVDNNKGIAESFARSDKYKIIDFVCEFGTFKVAIYNTTQLINEIATALYSREDLGLDFTLSYFFTSDGKGVFNLRSLKSKGDLCLRIAKSYGGGGHPNACGFSLPFSEGSWLIQNLSGF